MLKMNRSLLTSPGPFVSFPSGIKLEFASYKLVMIRKIPKHPAAAIYRSMPIFSRGKLIEDYLIMSPKLQALHKCENFDQALQTLFLTQSKMTESNRLKARVANKKAQQIIQSQPESA